VIKDALLGKQTSNYEFPLFSKNGERIEVLLNATTRRDVDGKIIGVVGVGQDITKMKIEQAKSVALATDLQNLINQANAPIFGVDTAGRVNVWNKMAEFITDVSAEVAMGKNFVGTYVLEEQRAAVQGVFSAALEGKTTSNYQMSISSRRRVEVLLNATTRRDACGAVVGVVGVGQDITEYELQRKKAELLAIQLTQKEAAMETEQRVTSYMSHELRNPLFGLTGCLEELSSKDVTEHERASLLESSTACARQMTGLCNAMLDIQKIESGTFVLGQKPIVLATLFAEVKLILQQLCQKGVVFHVNVEVYKPILGDALRLKQVLINLASNAAKFTTAGSITLSARIDGAGKLLRIVCADTGPGIPKVDLDKIFERFYQRGARLGSSGLGLSICKSLVGLMQGRIWMESDVGVGTQCIIELPLVLGHVTTAGAAENLGTPATSDGATSMPKSSFGRIAALSPSAPKNISKTDSPVLRILIVDDIKLNHSVMRRKLHRIFPSHQVEVDSVYCGEDCIAAFLAPDVQEYNVIIMDQHMGPGFLGTDTILLLRTEHQCTSKIIAVSGNKDCMKKFELAGADMFLEKPVMADGYKSICNLVLSHR